MGTRSYTIRIPRRWVRITMIVGITALVVAPLTAIATHTFIDVPASNTHHDDIAWLRDAVQQLRDPSHVVGGHLDVDLFRDVYEAGRLSRH